MVVSKSLERRLEYVHVILDAGAEFQFRPLVGYGFGGKQGAYYTQ